MKIEPTNDYDLIASLCGEDAQYMPPKELWDTAQGITVLVASDEGAPKMLAVLLEHGETGEPEVHIQPPPEPWKGTIKACGEFKQWILRNRTWKQVWSWTSASDTRTFQFAKHLGFEEAFDQGERKFIVLNLNN